jgi:segregation and condensation protein A
MNIHIDVFDGPLDLLYGLIEKNRIDIYDIPIAEITDQYIAFIGTLPDIDMDLTASFIVMAATLLEIKSKLLLPSPAGEAEESDPREQLVRRLLEYKQYKEAAKKLGEAFNELGTMYFRERDGSAFAVPPSKPELSELMRGVDLSGLQDAFVELLRRRERSVDRLHAGYGGVYRDKFTVEEKIVYIKQRLMKENSVEFEALFDERAVRAEIITTFLALLELIKACEIRAAQEGNFRKIIIRFV